MIRTTRVMAAATVGTLAWAGLAGAQSAKVAPHGPQGEERAAQQSAQVQDRLVSLDFHGGTVEEYVAAMRESATAPVNVVYQGGAESVRIPPISLKGVDIEVALRALEGRWGGRTLAVLDVQPRPSPNIQPQLLVKNNGGAPMFAIMQDNRGGPPTEAVTRVLSLNALTAPAWLGREKDQAGQDRDIAAETILTAIEEATGQHDADGPAQLKYHRQSGLLFIAGSPQQCKLADDVVSNLERDLKRERSYQVVQETFTLAHAQASDLMDALRMVMPSDPSRPSGVQVSPTEKGNGATVTTTEDMIGVVRAITRLVDKPAARSSDEVRLQLQLDDAMRRLGAAEAGRQDLERGILTLRGANESLQVRSDEMQKNAVGLSDQLTAKTKAVIDCESMRRQLEDKVTQLQDRVKELEARAPKP